MSLIRNVTQEQIATLAERYFGDLPARPAPPNPPANYPKGLHDIVVHGPVERHQITLALGARTVGCAHADRWPLEVLEELLGQRLLAELRYRRGLTYTPWAYNIFHRDSGYLAAQVTAADRHEEWARDTLQGEIDEITQGAPSRREVRPLSGIFDNTRAWSGPTGRLPTRTTTNALPRWPTRSSTGRPTSHPRTLRLRSWR